MHLSDDFVGVCVTVYSYIIMEPKDSDMALLLLLLLYWWLHGNVQLYLEMRCFSLFRCSLSSVCNGASEYN